MQNMLKLQVETVLLLRSLQSLLLGRRKELIGLVSRIFIENLVDVVTLVLGTNTLPRARVAVRFRIHVNVIIPYIREIVEDQTPAIVVIILIPAVDMSSRQTRVYLIAKLLP